MQIEVTLKDTATKALEAVLQAGKNLRPVLLDFGEHMVTSIQENFLRGGRPKWKPSLRAIRQAGKTLIDTSRLMSSITYQAGPDTLKIGTNVEYAALMHFGGTIRPKAGKKYLTIPLPGVTGTAGSYANTFVVWRKKGDVAGKGHGIIFQKTATKKGNEGKPRPLFVLMKKVTIPARPFLLLQPQDQDYLANSAGDHLADAWEKS